MTGIENMWKTAGDLAMTRPNCNFLTQIKNAMRGEHHPHANAWWWKHHASGIFSRAGTILEAVFTF